eukprot:1583177-Amphidinium_carterae.2
MCPERDYVHSLLVPRAVGGWELHHLPICRRPGAELEPLISVGVKRHSCVDCGSDELVATWCLVQERMQARWRQTRHTE